MTKSTWEPEFPFCPQPPDWSLDWGAIADAFEEIRTLQACRQDPVYHAEGDVLIHTRMVCESLVQSAAWRSLPASDRASVFAGALLHDVAKPQCTQDENGRITTRGHSLKGSRMSRCLFWKLWPDVSSPEFFQMREAVAGLVRHHGLPLYFLDRPDPRRALIEASLTARPDWVSLVAEADVLGRVCPDQSELLDRIAMFYEFAAELNCLDREYPFPSDHTRFQYFRRGSLAPDVEFHDDSLLDVTLACGLPASGKDTWIANNRGDAAIIALDEIREELDVSPDDNQGAVGNEARERARQFLRRRQPFIWNATNTTRMTRRPLIDLFASYRARVRIVYVEASVSELQRRNRARNHPVPDNVISNLRRKLDIPDRTEAPQIQIVLT